MTQLTVKTGLGILLMFILLCLAFTTKEFLISSLLASFCIIIGALVSKHLSNLSNNE
jgi:hypothetical protein